MALSLDDEKSWQIIYGTNARELNLESGQLESDANPRRLIRGRWCVSSSSLRGPLDRATLAGADHVTGSCARRRVTHAHKNPCALSLPVSRIIVRLSGGAESTRTPRLWPVLLVVTRRVACFVRRAPFSGFRQNVCRQSECRPALAPSWHPPQADQFWATGGGDSFLFPSYEHALTAVSLPAASARLTVA
jgi:hypothetical protein